MAQQRSSAAELMARLEQNPPAFTQNVPGANAFYRHGLSLNSSYNNHPVNDPDETADEYSAVEDEDDEGENEDDDNYDPDAAVADTHPDDNDDDSGEENDYIQQNYPSYASNGQYGVIGGNGLLEQDSGSDASDSESNTDGEDRADYYSDEEHDVPYAYDSPQPPQINGRQNIFATPAVPTTFETQNNPNQHYLAPKQPQEQQQQSHPQLYQNQMQQSSPPRYDDQPTRQQQFQQQQQQFHVPRNRYVNMHNQPQQTHYQSTAHEQPRYEAARQQQPILQQQYQQPFPQQEQPAQQYQEAHVRGLSPVRESIPREKSWSKWRRSNSRWRRTNPKVVVQNNGNGNGNLGDNSAESLSNNRHVRDDRDERLEKSGGNSYYGNDPRQFYRSDGNNRPKLTVGGSYLGRMDNPNPNSVTNSVTNSVPNPSQIHNQQPIQPMQQHAPHQQQHQVQTQPQQPQPQWSAGQSTIPWPDPPNTHHNGGAATPWVQSWSSNPSPQQWFNSQQQPHPQQQQPQQQQQQQWNSGPAQTQSQPQLPSQMQYPALPNRIRLKPNSLVTPSVTIGTTVGGSNSTGSLPPPQVLYDMVLSQQEQMQSLEQKLQTVERERRKALKSAAAAAAATATAPTTSAKRGRGAASSKRGGTTTSKRPVATTVSKTDEKKKIGPRGRPPSGHDSKHDVSKSGGKKKEDDEDDSLNRIFRVFVWDSGAKRYAETTHKLHGREPGMAARKAVQKGALQFALAEKIDGGQVGLYFYLGARVHVNQSKIVAGKEFVLHTKPVITQWTKTTGPMNQLADLLTKFPPPSMPPV